MISAETAPNGLVVLGRLGKAHGLKGEIRFFPFGCTQETFERVRPLRTNRKEIPVQSVRGSGPFWILQIQGVSTREAAAALTGQLVCTTPEDLPALPEMEFYEADLMEASVQTDTGEPLGSIQEIVPQPENDIFVVRDELGREHLIPALRHVLRSWDAEAKLLTVSWSDPEDEGDAP